MPPDPPASPHRRRVLGIVGAVVIVVLVAGLAIAREGADGPSKVRRRRTTTTTLPQPARFALGTVEPNGTAPPAQPVVDAVLAGLDSWANRGLVDPLRAGTDPPPLGELFTPGALAAAIGERRADLVALGLPKSAVRVVRATATLSSVAGPDGATAVVVAAVDLRLDATGKDHRVTVVRQGEIVFVPEANGAWRIDGWALHAEEVSV